MVCDRKERNSSFNRRLKGQGYRAIFRSYCARFSQMLCIYY
jgi:hypothetical protein